MKQRQHSLLGDMWFQKLPNSLVNSRVNHSNFYAPSYSMQALHVITNGLLIKLSSTILNLMLKKPNSIRAYRKRVNKLCDVEQLENIFSEMLHNIYYHIISLHSNNILNHLLLTFMKESSNLNIVMMSFTSNFLNR